MGLSSFILLRLSHFIQSRQSQLPLTLFFLWLKATMKERAESWCWFKQTYSIAAVHSRFSSYIYCSNGFQLRSSSVSLQWGQSTPGSHHFSKAEKLRSSAGWGFSNFCLLLIRRCKEEVDIVLFDLAGDQSASLRFKHEPCICLISKPFCIPQQCGRSLKLEKHKVKAVWLNVLVWNQRST